MNKRNKTSKQFTSSDECKQTEDKKLSKKTVDHVSQGIVKYFN